ncbi:MAG: 30S ribosomal protein THX [Anaerolineae bacterium]|nr:30S ribosomal protein THX [Anaerolineae bacterium]
MGKGDKRTKRGKLFRGTTGKPIPGKKAVAAAKTESKTPAKAPRAPREPREQPAPPPAEA